jgi:cation transport regulator ChaB
MVIAWATTVANHRRSPVADRHPSPRHHWAVSAPEVEERAMPKLTNSGTPKVEELPSTLQHSDKKAQRTFAKTLDSAEQGYGDDRRAHRVAYSALKHTHEKVGDHWEPKERNGPSDRQAAEGNADTDLGTAGGVDANASKKHLMDLAKRLDVRGRSSMTKDELIAAIEHANDRATARSRARS